MLRLRTVAALSIVLIAGLLAPATAASAATQLKAYISCDPETGEISTWTSGTLPAPTGTPTPVTIEFQRRGQRVSATNSAAVPPLATPFTVSTTATNVGDVEATGYTATFNPTTSLYYSETVVVTYKNAATGNVYTTRQATCDYDQRTTIDLTCDWDLGTVTAAVTGRDGKAGASTGAGRPTVIGYRVTTTKQQTADSPRFTEHLIDGWTIRRRISQAADGTWSDPGYVHTITDAPYYYAEELTVVITDNTGTTVGGGTTQCVLFDGSLDS